MNLGTEQLVGKIAAADLDSLAFFRDRKSWQLRPDGAGAFWLRLPAADAEPFARLALLARWSLRADGKLVRSGRQVPEATLPTDDWSGLDTWLPAGPPQRGAPGMPPERLPLHLESAPPGSILPPTAALLCELGDFASWAETAISPRLACLTFACNDAMQVFITGDPLPPVRGVSYYAADRIFIQGGHVLPAHLWPELIGELWGLGGNRYAILHPDGSHEEISAENLIPANRASVRLTAASFSPKAI